VALPFTEGVVDEMCRLFERAHFALHTQCQILGCTSLFQVTSQREGERREDVEGRKRERKEGKTERKREKEREREREEREKGG